MNCRHCGEEIRATEFGSWADRRNHEVCDLSDEDGPNHEPERVSDLTDPQIDAAAEAAYEAHYGHPPSIPGSALSGWQDVARAVVAAASLPADEVRQTHPQPPWCVDDAHAYEPCDCPEAASLPADPPAGRYHEHRSARDDARAAVAEVARLRAARDSLVRFARIWLDLPDDEKVDTAASFFRGVVSPPALENVPEVGGRHGESSLDDVVLVRHDAITILRAADPETPTGCVCKPGEGCDEEGDPGCAYCRALDGEMPCPADPETP